MASISHSSSKFALEGLSSLSDHFEITGTVDQDVQINQVHANEADRPPGSFQRAWRATMRSRSQQDAYRQGIENVRSLLREKYDQHAVNRFDRHFAYRRWAGKPLTVRALKVFVAKEEMLRQGSVNVSTLQEKVTGLDGLKEKLSDPQQKKWSVIGGGKVPSPAKTDYAFPFLPIAKSWFEFSANDEDFKKGREASIHEAREAVLSFIPTEITKRHVEHLFNARFAAKIKNQETLTVMELSCFANDAIKIRTNEDSIFGSLYQAAAEAHDKGEDVAGAIYQFFKETYHSIGVAAGAAIVLDQERNTNDPIMGLAKGFATGALLAGQSDTERIMTALAEHYIGTPAATPQTSATSRILKIFTFGFY